MPLVSSWRPVQTTLLEFGLRRAQGPDGGLSAPRYCYMGEVCYNSNCYGDVSYIILLLHGRSVIILLIAWAVYYFVSTELDFCYKAELALPTWEVFLVL